MVCGTLGWLATAQLSAVAERGPAAPEAARQETLPDLVPDLALEALEATAVQLDRQLEVPHAGG